MSKAEHYVDGKVIPLDDGMEAVDGNANPAGDIALFPGEGKVSPAEDTVTSPGEESPEEGVHKREQWSRKIDFLLACIGEKHNTNNFHLLIFGKEPTRNELQFRY